MCYGCTYTILGDEGVNLFDGNDLPHQQTQPLGVKEVKITQLSLKVTVVQEYTTLVKKMDGLQYKEMASKSDEVKVDTSMLARA